MGRFKVLYKVQFLETILCITTSSLLFLFVMLSESDITREKKNPLMKLGTILGNCTLEIYLIQFPIIDYVGALQMPSLLKLLIAVSSILLSAYILKLVSGFVLKKIS